MLFDSSMIQIHLVGWMLVFFRIAAFFETAPFFGSGAAPVLIKAYIAAVVGYFVYRTPAVVPLTHVPNLPALFFLIFKEIVLGLILAFLAELIHLPVRVMGLQVGRSAGMGRAQIFNPEEESRFTVLQQFMYIMGILIFFALDGHHLFLRALVLTFEKIPIGGIFLNGAVVREIVGFFTKAFNQGVAFAAPILACLVITSMCFGILSKTVPQMNLLVLGLPIRILVGLTGVFCALPMIASIFQKFLIQSVHTMERIIRIMSMGAA
jgi:flagellar biosynthetic protein FliR